MSGEKVAAVVNRPEEKQETEDRKKEKRHRRCIPRRCERTTDQPKLISEFKHYYRWIFPHPRTKRERNTWYRNKLYKIPGCRRQGGERDTFLYNMYMCKYIYVCIYIY